MTDEQFGKLYDKYSKTVFRVAYQYLMSRDGAEDIVQEVFLKLYTKAPSFRDSEHEKAWLLRVAVNLCINYKKAKNNNLLAINEEIELSDNSFEGKATAKLDIERELKRLAPAQRAAVYLYYYEGYSVKEISKLMKMKESTVKSHLKRARDNMKVNLEG